MPEPFASFVCIAPGVLIREVGGESVVLDLKTERYLGLDEVATRMWQLLLLSDSPAATFEKLVQEYDVDPQRLRKDLDEFVQQLLQLGLVQLNPAADERTPRSA